MEKKIILMAFIPVLIFIYGCSAPITEKTPLPDPSTISDDVFFSDDCDELVKQTNKLIGDANYCESDSDCVISTDIVRQCGCYSLLNKDADLTNIEKSYQKYDTLRRESIGNCLIPVCAQCNPTPTQEEVGCQNNKCVVIR